ncbi:elongation factor G [Frigidibacter sp. RF13]|uniref:elongation factor G n=1 Tax=Frigidibacter sp. RF13 TaxID=2997340 RepID=UPI002270084E|nr:elongation factor G [Frigidibacter sp. RF13]MCY1127863.1 elongation factor G [Frigidibacter sp. RF13]
MRLITVMGPSQSGKTELVKQMAQLDGHPPKVEQAGHLSLSRFTFMGEPWCAIDLAGGPEYARMVGQSLLASDAAVLCVAPDPNEAVLAAPYLRAIEASGTPCLIFINRMDAPKGQIRDVVSELQAYTSHAIVLRQIPIREGGQIVGAVDLISERAWRYREGLPSVLVEMPAAESDREKEARTALLEHMSEYDDHLLEELIEDHEPAKGALFEIARRETQESVILPCFLGAASHANGVTRLMKALRHEAPGVEALRDRLGAGEALAVGFHAQNRKHLGKCIFLRALGDGVAQGAALGGSTVGGLSELGGKSGHDRLVPGDVAISVKADHLNAGLIYTVSGATPAPDWAASAPPAMARLLTPAHEKDDARLSAALAKLGETDPGLTIAQDEATGHAVVRLQGPMHLRAVVSQLADGFGVDVDPHVPAPSYRETISSSVEENYRHRKQSGGAGQFADVAMIVAPQTRGAGFSFTEVVKGGAVPRNYIPSVEEGARDALVKGPLGFPVIDVAVTLTDGKHHAVDSSDFAFRTAGRQGVKEALAKAGPVLLQPVDRVEIHIPSIYAGSMVSLISSLKGQVLGFDRDPACRGWDIFRALLPAAAEEELVTALGSATQGTAWHEASFDHYEELYGREAERISKEHAEA